MLADTSFLNTKQRFVRMVDELRQISQDIARGLAIEMPMCSFVQENSWVFLAECRRRRRRHRWSNPDHLHSSDESKPRVVRD